MSPSNYPGASRYIPAALARQQAQKGCAENQIEEPAFEMQCCMKASCVFDRAASSTVVGLRPGSRPRCSRLQTSAAGGAKGLPEVEGSASTLSPLSSSASCTQSSAWCAVKDSRWTTYEVKPKPFKEKSTNGSG